jgi:broad specificity phosphatase PhoE
MIVCYLSHPQVDMEPDRPVPLWRLSTVGRKRVEALLRKPWLQGIGRIVASAETKAVETAAMISSHLHVAVEIDEKMGEIDRSSTGYLEPSKFELAADQFFGEPEKSWGGWERAVDASARIEAAMERALDGSTDSTLFVGHGAVGTLFKCRIAGYPIARAYDQPPGGGNIYAFGIASRQLLCDWTPIEQFEGVMNAE